MVSIGMNHIKAPTGTNDNVRICEAVKQSLAPNMVEQMASTVAPTAVHLPHPILLRKARAAHF